MEKTFKTIVLIALVIGSTKTIAQNAAINSTGSAPDASSMLDVSSTSKGMLMPRMTLAQKTAIASPATGLTVYQTDGTTGYYYYDGASWTKLATASTPTFLTKSTNYTITPSNASNDVYLFASGVTTGTCGHTLPAANSVSAGRIIKIFSGWSGSNTLNVLTNGTDTFYGSYLTNQNVTSIYTGTGNNYVSWVELVSDGSSIWYVSAILY